MQEVTYTAGKMLEFVATRVFNLNFENCKNSVVVPNGATISYDGSTAQYTKNTGEKVTGKTPYLKGAIAQNWLTLKTKAAVATSVTPEAKVDPRKNYDAKIGGDFEEAVKLQNDPVTAKKRPNIIREEDHIVKENAFGNESPATPGRGKLEVSNDQTEVSLVNSSTVANRGVKPHTTSTRKAEDYGAESSRPIKSAVEKSTPGKKKGFTVDGTTPSVPAEASIDEVKRAKGVIKATESQEAKVVKSIRIAPTVTEVDGIVLRKGGQPKDMDAKVTVGSGDKPITTRAKVSSGGSTTPVEISEGTAKVASEAPKTASEDYMSKLPEDWGDMHWTKKEQFIKALTDKSFIRFIMTVETVKAVQTACKDRLVELEKK